MDQGYQGAIDRRQNAAANAQSKELDRSATLIKCVSMRLKWQLNH
jgi:hypothetical protein